MKTNNTIDRIIMYLLLILTSILPFLTILSIQIPVNIGKYSIIGFSREIICLLLIFISILKIMGNKKVNLNIQSAFMIIYIIYGLVHIIISKIDIGIGVDKLRLIYLYPITFFIIYISNFKLDKSFIKKISKVLLIQFIIIAVFAIIEIIFKEKILLFLYKEKYYSMHLNLLGQQNIRTVSLLGNPINLGLFMNLSLVLLLFIKIDIASVLKLILIIINIVITFTTLSRTSYIIMILLIILYFIWRKITIKDMVCILALLCTVLLYNINSNTTNSYENSDNVIISRMQQMNMNYITGNSRIDNWKDYLDIAFNGDPHLYLWGSGLGSSNPDNSYQSEDVRKVENSYISILGELGVVGLTLYMILITYSIIIAIKIRKIDTTLSIISIGWFLVYLIGTMANDLHQNNPFSFYMWLFIFILEMYRKNNHIV